MHLLCNVSVGGEQDSGKLFDQVWSVASLLELLNARDDHVILDAIEIDLAVCDIGHVARRGRWCVCIDS